MALQYKIDVVAALKNAGYNPTIIRDNGLLGCSTMTKIRKGEGVGWSSLEQLCRLLNMQPGDIIEYISEADSALNDK